jgi:hypothetical protein
MSNKESKCVETARHTSARTSNPLLGTPNAAIQRLWVRKMLNAVTKCSPLFAAFGENMMVSKKRSFYN